MSYLLNADEILQTIRMIEAQHLDVRTITMGLSLLDCAGDDLDRCCEKIYDKICRQAGDLVKEESLESIAFVPKGTEPWTVELVFGEGDLSEEAQLTLAKMRLNSHRMEINTSGESTRICFFMYTDETEAENHEG